MLKSYNLYIHDKRLLSEWLSQLEWVQKWLTQLFSSWSVPMFSLIPFHVPHFFKRFLFSKSNLTFSYLRHPNCVFGKLLTVWPSTHYKIDTDVGHRIQSSVEFQVDWDHSEANHQFTNHACYSHKDVKLASFLLNNALQYTIN